MKEERKRRRGGTHLEVTKTRRGEKNETTQHVRNNAAALDAHVMDLIDFALLARHGS